MTLPRPRLTFTQALALAMLLLIAFAVATFLGCGPLTIRATYRGASARSPPRGSWSRTRAGHSLCGSSWYMNDRGRYLPIWVNVERFADPNDADAIIRFCQEDLQRRIDRIHAYDQDWIEIGRMLDPKMFPTTTTAPAVGVNEGEYE